MAIGLATAIVEAIMEGPEGGKYATMSMAGLDPSDPTRALEGLNERPFQYWPESISDTIDTGWQFKDIPGASHALAQWGSNNGRTITFDVPLHRFMKPRDSVTLIEQIKTMASVMLTTPNSSIPKDQRPFNVDVAAEIRFLRAFCYPFLSTAKSESGVLFEVILPPPIVVLSMPGIPLNENGTSVIYAVMTGCDVTYNLLFPDGTPRRVTVSLTFRQIVQRSDLGVYWSGHNFENKYKLGSDEGLTPGGRQNPGNLSGYYTK